MPTGTETSGMPFSLSAFPHADGPLDAFDDPSVRQIVLQWGTRLGKTTLCLSLMAKQAGTDPRNMMFASSTQGSAVRVVDSRLYPILASTDGVKDQLLPEHRRSQLLVKLGTCRIYVGWSGSEASLADVGAKFGVANEIDKWDGDASNEADSLALFRNRFKGFPSHKIIFESTPTIKGKSRVEALRLASKNHRRYVPCPHCGEYQILVKGSRDTPGGFRWDHDSKGGSDAEIAYTTAWYECCKCQEKIENHHRVGMLRNGVWVPDGCSVTTDGEIIGEAINANSETWGFGPLPSWYALTETWGHFARAWVSAQGKPRDLQDVVNSYMAETWEVKKTKSEPEVVGERLSGNCPRSYVPAGVEFLTVTVDRQEANGGFCPWVVMGHGADDRTWVIDYGSAASLQVVREKVLRFQFQSEDVTLPGLIARMSGIDSGWDTKGTYDFCAENHLVAIALKGSSNDLGGSAYRIVELERSRHAKGQRLMHVNTDFWETDLHNRMEKFLHDEPGSLTLFKEARFDMAFLTQLCNGVLEDAVDRRGNVKWTWVKRDEQQPNDYRDCVRYGLCLGKFLRDNPILQRVSFSELQRRRREQRM